MVAGRVVNVYLLRAEQAASGYKMKEVKKRLRNVCAGGSCKSWLARFFFVVVVVVYLMMMMKKRTTTTMEAMTLLVHVALTACTT